MSASESEGLMPPTAEQPSIRIEDCIPMGYDFGLLLAKDENPSASIAHLRQDVQLVSSLALSFQIGEYLQAYDEYAPAKELRAKEAELLTHLNNYADLWHMDYESAARRTQFLLVVDACIHDGINLFDRVAMPNPDAVIAGGQKFFQNIFEPTPEQIDEVQSKYFFDRYARISRSGAAVLANLDIKGVDDV